MLDISSRKLTRRRRKFTHLFRFFPRFTQVFEKCSCDAMFIVILVGVAYDYVRVIFDLFNTICH